MSRLASALGLDIKIQFRNKYYHIGIALALLMGIGLGQFLDKAALQVALPVLFVLAVGGTTYIFVAGLIIFEKNENTLNALVISPMRVGEYLSAKVISLTLLALIDSMIIVLISYGASDFNPLLFFGGVMILGVFLTMAGFIHVVRYDSVTDFLMPAVVVTAVLQLPFLHLLGIMESPIWYAIPTMAPAILMKAAFLPVESWELIYALVYSLAALVVTYHLSLGAFEKFVVLRGRG